MPSSAAETTDQTAQTVWEWLQEVSDPEIPVISLVDLGVIRAVELDGDKVTVELLPTFLGCPALVQMKRDIVTRLEAHGLNATVVVNTRDSWTSEMITETGRARLRESGFAPPHSGQPSLLQLQGPSPCPYCGSEDTRLENLFGPTPCRSLRYCNSCRQPFEQFKSL
jgi:ring-1,2-phenylacetyl-CoA epoxidase subunit PaaD